MSGPIEAYFVCGGKYHDMDFARVEVLKLLGEHEEIRTQVGPDYRDSEAISRADFLVSYTCDLSDTTEEQQNILKSLPKPPTKLYSDLHSAMRSCRSKVPNFFQQDTNQHDYLARQPIIMVT